VATATQKIFIFTPLNENKSSIYRMKKTLFSMYFQGVMIATAIWQAV
jgi:hypothetical protein